MDGLKYGQKVAELYTLCLWYGRKYGQTSNKVASDKKQKQNKFNKGEAPLRNMLMVLFSSQKEACQIPETGSQ